jgi:hypothetical protein
VFGGEPSLFTAAMPAGAGRDLDQAVATGARAVAMLELVRSTLVPAYRRAVDALDPLAALELARHVVGSMQVAREGRRDVGIASADRDRFGVCTPGEADPSEAVIAGKLGQLDARTAELQTALPALEDELAVKLGPQMFREQAVLGSYVQPKLGTDPGADLAREAGATVELISVVRQVCELSGVQPGASKGPRPMPAAR